MVATPDASPTVRGSEPRTPDALATAKSLGGVIRIERTNWLEWWPTWVTVSVTVEPVPAAMVPGATAPYDGRR